MEDALTRREYPAMLVSHLSHLSTFMFRQLTGSKGTFTTSRSGRKIQGASEQDWEDQYRDCGLASGKPRRIHAYKGQLFTHSQERRKAEEIYVAALRKLSKRQLQDVQADLGYCHLN
jgi:hypothetical protein